MKYTLEIKCVSLDHLLKAVNSRAFLASQVMIKKVLLRVCCLCLVH